MSICENCGLPITAKRPGAENGLPLHRALWVCIDARKDEIERLRAEVKQLRVILGQLEWIRARESWFMLYTQPKYCQICASYEHQGHAPDCKLAAVLGTNGA